MIEEVVSGWWRIDAVTCVPTTPPSMLVPKAAASLLMQAALDLDIVLPSSVVIGDFFTDLRPQTRRMLSVLWR